MNKSLLVATLILSASFVIGCSTAIAPNTEQTTPEDKAPLSQVDWSQYQDNSNHHDDDEYSNLPDYEISAREVLATIRDQRDVVTIDVREDYELQETGIILGSLHIPLGDLSVNRLTEAGISKTDKIIVYCRSGNRSRQAYDLLNVLGYLNAKSMQGGIIHWQEDSRPLVPWDAEAETRVKKSDLAPIDGPQASFNVESKDLGMVAADKTTTTTFSLSNTGTQTLEVGTISTSCACTAAKIESKSIAPGKSTKLTVIFDPNVHEEPKDQFKRTVFLETNDPNNPELEVSILVDIDEQS